MGAVRTRKRIDKIGRRLPSQFESDTFGEDHFCFGATMTHLARFAILLAIQPFLCALHRFELDTTMRFGFQSPSSVSVGPPRIMYLPPYFSTVAPASFLYSS